MILPDVIILVYAAMQESANHQKYHQWLEGLLQGTTPFGIADLTLSGFLRVATNKRIFANPLTLNEALLFANAVRLSKNAVVIAPGPQHWDLFTQLCSATNAQGNGIPDAYFAALAIESNCEWITNDRGFSRFPGLNWRAPW